MVDQPVQKCGSPSAEHGHKPGRCDRVATEPDQLCKPCFDQQAAEADVARVTIQKREPIA
jgi:hypothetical protein